MGLAISDNESSLNGSVVKSYVEMAENRMDRRIERIREKKGATMPAERKQRKGHWIRAAAFCAAVFIMVCILGLRGPAAAGDLKVIRGIVGTVTGSMMYLEGKSVDLAGVTIQDPSGKDVLISEITPGTKVGLYYRRGTLSSVLVYPAMVE